MCVIHSVISNALGPCGLYPARLLCPWNSPGKNTGMGCHSLLQGDLPDPGMELRYPALQVDSLPSALREVGIWLEELLLSANRLQLFVHVPHEDRKPHSPEQVLG